MPVTTKTAPLCPNCHKPLDVIYTSRQVHIYWDKDDGRWVEGDTSYDTTYQCCHCYEELTVEDLDNLGVPNEIR